jgi:hypothetical protein
MNIGQWVFLALILGAGIYIGAKKPSLVSTLTFGALTA